MEIAFAVEDLRNLRVKIAFPAWDLRNPLVEIAFPAEDSSNPAVEMLFLRSIYQIQWWESLLLRRICEIPRRKSFFLRWICEIQWVKSLLPRGGMREVQAAAGTCRNHCVIFGELDTGLLLGMDQIKQRPLFGVIGKRGIPGRRAYPAISFSRSTRTQAFCVRPCYAIGVWTQCDAFPSFAKVGMNWGAAPLPLGEGGATERAEGRDELKRRVRVASLFES